MKELHGTVIVDNKDLKAGEYLHDKQGDIIRINEIDEESQTAFITCFSISSVNQSEIRIAYYPKVVALVYLASYSRVPDIFVKKIFKQGE